MRILIILFSVVLFSYAHKLNIFITQENGTIYINSYFASGQACQNCEVSIFDERNKLLNKGESNSDGYYTLDVVPHPIEVQVDAGSGHMQMRSFIPEVENTTTTIDIKKELILEKKNNSFSDIFKMLLGLILIAAFFFVLKRVRT